MKNKIKLKYLPWIIFPIAIILLLLMRTNIFINLNLNFEYIHNLCGFATLISIYNNMNPQFGPILIGIISLLLTLLFGPIFCSYLCPFGTFQRIIRKIGIKLGIKSRKIPNKIHKTLIFLKYIFLGLLILLIIFKSIYLYINIDPYHAFIRIFYGGLTISGSIYLLIVTLLSLSYDRPFCNYLCPYGAFFNIISINRVFKVTRNPDKCVDCKICDKNCPVNIKVSSLDTVNNINCLNCNSCIDNCKIDNAIGLKTNFSRVITFITLLLTIYFSFILIEKYNSNNNILTIAKKTINVSSTNSSNSNSNSNSNPTTKYIYNDGTYKATVDAYRRNMVIQINIENDIITDITILDHNDTKSYVKFATPTIIENILKNNSTDIDVVSGATYTSNGIKNGVNKCLEQAKK
ncbi:MAG: 4Fe-4S binding protein [Bacillota bacterium]|nr:4Fe-4S binding protein [Bacillota bacterium]